MSSWAAASTTRAAVSAASLVSSALARILSASPSVSSTACSTLVVEVGGADRGAGGAVAFGVAAGAVVDGKAGTGRLVRVAGEFGVWPQPAQRTRPPSSACDATDPSWALRRVRVDWAASNSAWVTIGACASGVAISAAIPRAGVASWV